LGRNLVLERVAAWFADVVERLDNSTPPANATTVIEIVDLYTSTGSWNPNRRCPNGSSVSG
jgi:hypothetical protein